MKIICIACAALFLHLAASHVLALGMDFHGHKPLPESNFKAWPGVMPAVNHTRRKYSRWVNGDNRMFYDVDNGSANALMASLSALEVERVNVLIRPGTGTVKALDGREVQFDCELRLVGGVAAVMMQNWGDWAWFKHPTLTLYTGGTDLSLKDLNFPDNVHVLSLGEVHSQLLDVLSGKNDQALIGDRPHRAANAARNDSESIRGHVSNIVVALNPYSTDVAKTLVTMLGEDDGWNRQAAAGALSMMGKRATPALPALKKIASEVPEDERVVFTHAIDQITKAKDDEAAATKFEREQGIADAFVKNLNAKRALGNTETAPSAAVAN